MPRNHDGHINYAIVEKSIGLQRIVDLLKTADHPLSSMEITLQAFLPNASTRIDEIRKNDGTNPGTNRYIVSAATKFKAPDGARYPDKPWMDGKARYWLIEAPGWSPRWTVTDEGELMPFNRGYPMLSSQGAGEPSNLAPDAIRLCKNPACLKPLPNDGSYCCGDECRDAWRESLLQPCEQVRLRI